MKPSLTRELHFSLVKAYYQLIPLPEDRERLTWGTASNAFGYLIPFFFMAYLTRRRDTYLIRLLLLPTTAVMILRGTYGYGGYDPQFAFFTWIRGLAGLTALALTLQYALTPEGTLRVNESSLPAINEPSLQHTEDEPSKTQESKAKSSSSIFPFWFSDTLDLISSMRGIGWQFGRGVFIPKDHRPHQRGPFLLTTLRTFFLNFLLMDLSLVIFHLIPGIGSPGGGSLYFTNLPLVPRQLIALAITILSALALIPGFRVLECIPTLIGVGLLGHSPSQYPPIEMNPWGADSLHDFWGKRWHQTLRQTFLIFGGYPGRFFIGRTGWVLGTFLASGFFHEYGTYVLDKGLDHRVTAFFFLQGVGMMIEKVYSRTTGRRVKGLLGRLWTYLFVLGLGQLTLDAWFTRGLAGGIIIPPAISPSTKFVFPIVKRLLKSYTR
ncbi:hypothetical protein C8Q75DRAFT_525894 [Abortiporus biennis]|nr:hypothetical protein C8Q75DRAFT_525894 [Abortiporus biennis]